MADRPTVEAFRAHEAQHGPWMRIRTAIADNPPMWVQTRVEVVRDGDRSYLVAIICRGVGESFGENDFPEWEWCDADGRPVPDIRPVSELTSERLTAWPWWFLFRGLDLGTVVRGDSEWVTVHRGRLVSGFPIRDGQPWRPARWSEIDAAVAARKEKS